MQDLIGTEDSFVAISISPAISFPEVVVGIAELCPLLQFCPRTLAKPFIGGEVESKPDPSTVCPRFIEHIVYGIYAIFCIPFCFPKGCCRNRVRILHVHLAGCKQ